MSKRISKADRARIVELLRCAADVSSICEAGIAMGYADGIGPCAKVYALACDAYNAHPDIIHGGGWHSYPGACLEAAIRVEQGWTP